MTSADFCMLSTVSSPCSVFAPFRAYIQISPGIHTFFLSIRLPHLPCMIPCSYRALACMAVLPSCMASMRFLFIRPEICPSVYLFPTSSFLQIPPRDGHPCLRLYPSPYRADSGLSPVRTCARRAHHKNSPVRSRLTGLF